MKNLLRLEVFTEDDEFADRGQLWLANRIQEVMHVETLLLAALDHSMDLLTCYGPLLHGTDKIEQLRSVRLLVGRLLAVRHEYLDAVFYSRAAAIEREIMKQVKVLVVSGSNLTKIIGGQSNWSKWFFKRRKGLILMDELPGQSIEEVAAQIICFKQAILCGDRNQFSTEQQRASKEGKGNPFKRTNAAVWVEKVAKRAKTHAYSFSHSFQYRFGRDTIDLLKYVFPTKFDDLSCPEKNFHNTLVLPYFFKLEEPADRWVYCKQSREVLRSRPIFAQCLAIVASEMLLARARDKSSGSCQLLIMWCLKAPLNQLLLFLETNIVCTCKELHRLWDIPEPPEGYAVTYNLSTWQSTYRFQAKAGQNAHGSHSEIALWFLCRRQEEDWGWCGEQAQDPHVFEQYSRATRRQHVFIEDLRSEIELPSSEKFSKIKEPAHAGSCKRSMQVGESTGRHYKTCLRLVEFMEEALQVRHKGSNFLEGLPVLFRSDTCKQLICAESELGNTLLGDVRPNQVHEFLSHCETCYQNMDFSLEPGVHGKEELPTVQQLFQSYRGDSRYWLDYLQANQKTKEQRQLPHWSDLKGRAEATDFELWREVVLPTFNVLAGCSWNLFLKPKAN